MDEINVRFKELRKACNKTQEEWGNILGIKVSGVSNIENGMRKVTDKHLIMLSNWKGKNINVDWLKTGDGEKFKDSSLKEDIGYFVEELLDYEENPLYDIIIDMMKTYHELDEKSQTVIRRYFDKVRERAENKKKED